MAEGVGHERPFKVWRHINIPKIIMKKDVSKQLKKLPDNEVVFYQSQDGLAHIEVLYAEENIWLSQKRMAELFGTTKQNISLHLMNIFKDKELMENSVVKDFLTTADDGKNYETKMYSLEAIIAMSEMCLTKRS